MLIARDGVYVVIANGVALVCGAETVILRPNTESTTRVFGASVTDTQLAILTTGAATLFIPFFVTHRTHFGLRWRAVASDSTLASLLGVGSHGLRTIAVVVGSALPGLSVSAEVFRNPCVVQDACFTLRSLDRVD